MVDVVVIVVVVEVVVVVVVVVGVHKESISGIATVLAGQIQRLSSVSSGILLPGHTHWSRLLVSRTRSPGQKHSSGLLGLGT